MLSSSFVAALPADVRRPAVTPSLEAALADVVARAREAWPELAIRDLDVVSQLAARWAGEPPTSSLIAEVHAGDLGLAVACAAGERAALVAFTAAYRVTIRAAVARVAGTPAAADDLAQQALERLVVARDDGPPRIGRYSGRAPLAGFVRVVAVRLAVSAARVPRREIGDEPLAAVPDRADDPELQYLKTLYRSEFRTAFATAVAELAPRDRTLLRYHISDGLTVEQLATVYGRPRSTIHRHLANARARLIEGTRAALRGALALDTDQLDSVLRLVQSGVDVSMQRLLAEPRPADAAADLDDEGPP